MDRRPLEKARFGAAFGLKWAGQRVGEALGRPELARPTQVCAPLTSRCNFGCGFCPHPTAQVHHEISFEKWCELLLELREWLGTFRINFLGGEPFLYADLYRILGFCRDNGIYAGITTNGSALTERNARRVAELEPFNISISLDSVVPEKHDANRRFEGSYRRIMEGIEHLNRYRTDRTRICLRTTVMEWNVHELVEIADLGRELGVVVGFQPVEYRDFQETHADPDDYQVRDDLAEHAPALRFSALSLDDIPAGLEGNWVTSLDVLDAQIEALIERKRRGWPLLNSVYHLQVLRDAFHQPDLIFSIPRDCKTAWEHLIILPNGSVRSCSEQPTYGNVFQDSIRDIWTSAAAAQHRDNCANCDRTCMNMFHWKRSITEKAAMFWEFF